MKNKKSLGEIIIYEGTNGFTNIEVRIENETVWLSQKQIAELFDTTKQNISQHIGKFKEGELAEDSVVKKILTTADDKKGYNIEHYNLNIRKINKKTI